MSQLLGMIHPRLRTLALIKEVFNPERKIVDLRIGSPIKPHKFSAHQNDRALARHFQMRSEVLHYKESTTPTTTTVEKEPIVARQPVQNLVDEIESLPDDSLLCQLGTFSVYSATGNQIPAILHEIGRTREITFRSVGEGVGKAIDIDPFDYTLSLIHI